MNCWTVLGIDYTSDIIAIKRAYAIKLKITRPDDDAAAYQELRDAYQLAIKEAKLFSVSTTEIVLDNLPSDKEEFNNNIVSNTINDQDNADFPISDAATKQKDNQSAESTQSNIFEREVASDRVLGPVQLAEQVLNQWRLLGDTDLQSYWPELERLLMLTPLPQANQYSVEFAELVLDNRLFPAEFTERLMEYFEWKVDFRLGNILGNKAWHTLQERLQLLPFQIRANLVNSEFKRKKKEAAEQAEADAIAAVQPRNHALRERYRELMRMAQVPRSEPATRTEFLAFLAGPQLQREWFGLTEQQFDVLGISATARERVTFAFKQTRITSRIVTSFLILFCIAIRWIIGDKENLAIPLVLLGFVVCYFMPIGYLNETLRNRLFPERILNHVILPGVLNSRLFSILYCTIAASVSVGFSRGYSGSGNIYPTGALVFIAILLICSWLTKPSVKIPALDIIPSIFLLCLLSVWTQGADNLPLIITVAATWHALSYSILQFRGQLLLGVIFFIGCALLFIHPDSVCIAFLSFCIPWLLFRLSTSQSIGFVSTAICLAWVTLPTKNAPYLMLWTGVVAMLVYLTAIGMRKLSNRK